MAMESRKSNFLCLSPRGGIRIVCSTVSRGKAWTFQFLQESLQELLLVSWVSQKRGPSKNLGDGVDARKP